MVSASGSPEYWEIHNLSASRKPIAASDEYFHNYVLKLSPGLEARGTVQWDLLLCMILAWVVICGCVFKGIRSSGKAAYITALFPYVLLLILFISGLMMDGAVDGIIYYFKPDLTKLASIKVWGDAAVQVFFTLSLSIGTVATLASFNDIHHDSIKDVFVLCIGDTLTAIFAGFIIFAYLGAMAHRLGTTVAEVATQGAGLAFIVFPDAVTMLPVSQLWMVLFMIVMIMLGVGTVMASMNVLMTFVSDMFPIFEKKKYNMGMVVGFFLMFITISIPFCTNAGMYMVQFMDTYSQTYALLVMGVIFCVAVAWIHGREDFGREFALMYGRQPSPFWIIMARFVSPTIIIFILVLTLYDFKRSFYGDYMFPLSYDIGGWFIVLGQLVIIPAYAVYQLRTQHTDLPLRQRIFKLLKKTEKWEEHERHEYEADKRRAMHELLPEEVPLKPMAVL
jgi:solute carrier family 6 amino acid transporter-like protein 5/7/9/14